ncbi:MULTISPECIES: ABC transporter permease [Enterobacterales]|uniref:ABC transporter permease n=1 Tax=Enterobacterales TaxID=91347 RepID=UPI002ED80C7A
MARFLLFRTAGLLLLLMLASLVIFFSLELAPGDAAAQALGERATPQMLTQLRHEYGLDSPAGERYLHWLSGVLHGNGGYSLLTDLPVSEVVIPAAQRSALLAACAGMVMLLVGMGAGMVAAAYRGQWLDKLLSALALIGVSMPEFIVATLLILLFAVGLGWLPAISLAPLDASIAERWRGLVLPALTLGLVASGYLLRMVRATLLNVMTLPHVTSARLNGIRGRALWGDHILPIAAGPLAQIIASTLPYLFGGAIVVERVFGYPGMGELLLNAFHARDTALLQGIAMLLALVTAACWFMADVLARVSDPWRRR